MRSLIVFSSVLALSQTVSAMCYFPNGQEAGSDTACNPNSLVSACCFDNQACLSNGLCVSDPHDPVKARLHRGTCTDKAWKSGNCPRQCLSINNNGVPVYSCNSTTVDSYCCFDNCKCDRPFEVFSFNQSPADVQTQTIIGELFTQTTRTSSTPTSTSAPTTAPGNGQTTAVAAAPTSAANSAAAPQVTSAPASTEAAGSSNSVALGAGLGVGIPALAALLVGAFFLWRRKKGTKQYNGDAMGKPVELHEDSYYPPPANQKYAYYAETEGYALSNQHLISKLTRSADPSH